MSAAARAAASASRTAAGTARRAAESRWRMRHLGVSRMAMKIQISYIERGR
jgi:hypothetical protein